MTTKTTSMALLLIAALALVMPGSSVAQDADAASESETARGERGWGHGPRGRGHMGPGMRSPGPFGLGGPMDGKGIRMALRHLDLSESQREEIKTIFEDERDPLRGNHERMRALADDLREQIETDPYNEEAVRAKAEAVAEVGVEMAVLRARQTGLVREVLTPEQISKLEEMKATREAFRAERRGLAERYRERARNR